MSLFVIIIATLVGRADVPAMPGVPVRGQYTTLAACEAVARVMPVDSLHRAMCVPAESIELAANATV